jgi:hypothetical protein
MHGRQGQEKRKQLTRECMADQKNSRRNNAYASETGVAQENAFQTGADVKRMHDRLVQLKESIHDNQNSNTGYA